MSKKQKPRKSEKRPPRLAAEKAVSEELSEQQLENVTGGAVDASIQSGRDAKRVPSGGPDAKQAAFDKDFS